MPAKAIAFSPWRGKNTDSLTQAIAEAPAGALHFIPFDLSQLEAIPDLVRDLKTAHGPLYGLVNNAALGTEGLLSNMHNSKIEALIRLNVLSPVLLTKYVLRGMMGSGEGPHRQSGLDHRLHRL